MSTNFEHSRRKQMLGTIVRRHLRRGGATGPLGRLIAEEQRTLDGSGAGTDPLLESRLVDRLLHRFFSGHQPTCEAQSLFGQETRLA